MTPTQVRELLEQAAQAATHSYCPYSQFSVGAAIKTEDGTVFTGCNVENASYGATLCAERSVVAAAIGSGHNRFEALAVVAPSGALPYPCGVCRQVLAEFCDGDFPIFLASGECAEGHQRVTLADLFPCPFELPYPSRAPSNRPEPDTDEHRRPPHNGART